MIANSPIDGVFHIGHPSEMVLALVSGLPSRERITHRMAVIRAQAFADDSGKAAPFYVFSGFVSSAAAWASFSDEWDSALTCAQPRKIGFVKMQNAHSLNGEFAGFSNFERDRLMCKLWDIVNRYIEYGISVVVDDKYNSAVRGKIARTMDSPYFVLSTQFMFGVLDAEYKKGISRQVDFIFDEQGREADNVFIFWHLMQQSLPSRYRRRMGQNPIWRSEKEFLPLQAADMLAWETRHCAASGSPASNEIEILQRLRERLPNLEVPLMVGFVDADRLGNDMEYRKKVEGFPYSNARMRSDIHKRWGKLLPSRKR